MWGMEWARPSSQPAPAAAGSAAPAMRTSRRLIIGVPRCAGPTLLPARNGGKRRTSPTVGWAPPRSAVLRHLRCRAAEDLAVVGRVRAVERDPPEPVAAEHGVR